MTRIERILRSRLVRDLTLVGGGTAVAQGISLLITPLLTRLYAPIAYGQASVFVAIVTVLVPTLTLTLPYGIVLAPSDHEARHLARVSIFVVTVGSVLITLWGFASTGAVATLTGIKDPALFLWLLFPVTVAGALQLIGQQWLVRQKAYRVSAAAAVGGATLSASIRAIFGWISPMSIGLIFGTMAGYIVQAMPSLGEEGAFRRGNGSRSRTLGRRFGYIVKRYNDFIRFRTPQLLLNTASAALPIMALGIIDTRAAGYFALAKSVVDAPTTLVGKAVTDVLNPRIVDIVRTKRPITPLLVKATFTLAFVAAPAYLIISLFGPKLFILVFGARWETAGEYARWMAIWMLFGFANRPTVTAAAPLEIQHALLVYEIITTLGKLVALYIGIGVMHDGLQAVKFFCLTGAISYLGLIIWILVSASRHDLASARNYS